MSEQRVNRDSRARLWLLGLAPLVVLAVLLAVLVASEPLEHLRGSAPPVEELVFERVELGDDGIVATVVNDGPDPVIIAQVLVDEAYWDHTVEPDRTLEHLQRAEIHVPYPWVHGEAHELRLISSTGVTFDHEIAVATETPTASWRIFGLFALVGLYVGVIPVALGLLWYPLVTRLGRAGLDFVLALTVGLLVFLFVDTVHEGIEAAGEAAASYQGVSLFVFAALGAYLGMEWFGAWMRQRREAASGWVNALLVAIGIGLHNLGEGLAIGAAFALGEAALGTLLIVGFMLHNTTEGLAIVAPLAREGTSIVRLVVLGAVAGVPTIAGAWLGGLVFAPLWAVVFLGVGAGAIAQVVVQIVRSTVGEREVAAYLTTGAVVSGLFAGVAIMYVTGLVVGS